MREVRVCQSRACRKQNGTKVLEAFQKFSLPNVIFTGSSCLGQCGNGPMVLVIPDQVWYSRVHPDEVATVVEKHLLGGHPVQVMLYSKFHQLS